MKKSVIILPTYNESSDIEQLIRSIFEHTKESAKLWEIHILVVDSESEDHTGDIVESLSKEFTQLHLLRTQKEGLGKAYMDGFHYAIDKLKPFVIFEMDADLSHDPKCIPLFLKEIENGADFVIGSRYMKGGSIPSDWAFHRKLFSFFGNLVIRAGFASIGIADWTSGFRAIKTWVIQSSLSHIKNYSGYVFQVAILDIAKKQHARIKELPIQFIDRKNGVSKINSGQYIFQILLYVITESSFIKFFVVGASGFVVDSGLLYLFAFEFHLIPALAKSLSVIIVILWNFSMNNFWSFSHKRLDNSVGTFLKGLMKFYLVSSGNMLIQVSGITLLTHFFGNHNLLIFNALIILLFVIPYSYFMYNKVVWKKK
ncbi:MAG: glycosyltransferase family 2 protein [Candidatus Roizmanbacteria bacterium]